MVSTFGMNPQQIAQFKEVGKYVKARFIRRRSGFTLEFLPTVSQQELDARKIDLAQISSALVQSMAIQLYSFMAIGGEIEDE